MGGKTARNEGNFVRAVTSRLRQPQPPNPPPPKHAERLSLVKGATTRPKYLELLLILCDSTAFQKSFRPEAVFIEDGDDCVAQVT